MALKYEFPFYSTGLIPNSDLVKMVHLYRKKTGYHCSI